MASSDEEGEIVPECIINYYFVDCNDQPVSFVLLPLQWDGSEISMSSSTHLFVRGTADDQYQKVYKKAVAWKFNLCFHQPEIYVLLPKYNTWAKLLRPRKSYQEIIRPVLAVVHCLQFVKYNPKQSREAVWKHIVKTLSTCEVLPCEDDLLKHISILRDTALRDNDVSKSKYLAGFLSETSMRSTFEPKVNQATKRHKFIVDEDDDISGGDDEDDGKQEGIFDHVCALCDNGGELLCCEGRCIRSFHPTIESGADSLCESLGYTSDQVEAIQKFLCKNCQYGLHQCFVCGLLGYSDSSSGPAEVVPCVSATCGHFFHPKCISELVYPYDETQAIKLEKQISDGESFTCPAHKCFTCNQVEDKKVNELQFAVCRRCPKAYHRKCLPRSITFETNVQQNIQQRAWDGLLPGRILIYCMEHEMIPTIGTPGRDHILFPFEAQKDKQTSGQLSSKETVLSQRRTKVYGAMREMVEGEGENPFQRFLGDSIKKEGKPLKVASTLKMSQTVKTVQGNYMSIPKETYKPPNVEKSKFKAPVNMRLVSKRQNISQRCNVVKREIMVKDNSEWPSQNETEKSIRALVESVDSSFDAHKFMMEHKKKSIHKFSSKFDVVKTITEAKVERAVKAVQAALKKLDEGHSIQDAKAICEPEVLNNIFKWKKNLGSYLAPFLNGMRYTSFGRHFTKPDKLVEIVNRLRWYVQDGDTIVDFCCGSNDFSCLMKEELQKMGKACEFKNYDLIQPKNDFNFEKRDWMSVEVGELPEGSKLIMGLNPPFANANGFLSKALTFRPKLLIVTVPKETTRLDGTQDGYDIIWEDHKILAGKSFYLPGSVDVRDQQMEQWNIDPPPLYLWSRPDWTAKHKAVALEHGHIIITEQEQHPKEAAERSGCRKGITNYLMEETQDCYRDLPNVLSGYSDINSTLDGIPDAPDDNELGKMEAFGCHVQEGGLPEIEELTDYQDVNEVEDMCVDMELSTPASSPLLHLP